MRGREKNKGLSNETQNLSDATEKYLPWLDFQAVASSFWSSVSTILGRKTSRK